MMRRMKHFLRLCCVACVPFALAACSMKTEPVIEPNSDTGETSSSPMMDEDAIRAKLIDALVNKRLRIDVVSEEGGRHGCEPQNPYYTLKVQRRRTEGRIVDPDVDGGHFETVQAWEDTDLGDGITLEPFDAESEVRVMDTCFE